MAAGPVQSKTDPIAEAIEAMKRAADVLASTARGSATEPGHTSTPAPSPAADDEQAQRYYRDKEHRGEIADVDDTTDVASLPPEVTHVRYPDGRVRRLGFS